ncbi:DUF3311 domain-containing protein [Solicola gregarius]|uniref:DUF3311 domain-containing protein n=1 Tax=Solicola gregarius TaxID=2908642 RepID=A0AA46YJA9_9ACTN|nr:DUF3311 domain-containing protein [Solicola gregarius]UYM04137.1 DUF3311 domain-containing protein [Solicola gregarius]
MSQRSFRTLFVVICVITFVPVMFPVFEIANRATPIVAGLPFGFFWVVLWVVIIAICVALLYRVDPDNRGTEED